MKNPFPVRGRQSRLRLLILLGLLTGCHDSTALTGRLGPAVSTVYSAFAPQEEFARRGFRVDAEVEGGKISPRECYGWKPMQGSLVLPAGTGGCEAVVAAIRDALDHTLDEPCWDELTPTRVRDPGRPLYGMLRYEQEGMRGHVYVWLFPDKSETTIRYAILLREERLPSGDATTMAGIRFMSSIPQLSGS